MLTDQTRTVLPGDFTQLSDGFVHYEFVGSLSAPVVVLVHGFSVPYYIWDPTMSALSGHGFAVLRYDLFGRGYSDRPEVDYNLDLYVKQLQELLASLNIDRKIHLIGLSQGGPIVAAYAHHHPDQVLSITLIDPLINQVMPGDIFPLNVPVLGDYLARVVLFPYILPKSQANDFYHPEEFPDWELKYRDQMKYKGFRRAILSSIRNLGDIHPLDEYKRAYAQNLPFLLIWGKEDQTIPFKDIERFLDVLPKTEFHIIQDAGHLSHYEKPATVNPILLKFLRLPEP